MYVQLFPICTRLSQDDILHFILPYRHNAELFQMKNAENDANA